MNRSSWALMLLQYPLGLACPLASSAFFFCNGMARERKKNSKMSFNAGLQGVCLLPMLRMRPVYVSISSFSFLYAPHKNNEYYARRQDALSAFVYYFYFYYYFFFRLYLIAFSFNFHLWTSQWMLWVAAVDGSVAVATLEAIVKRRHLAFLCRFFFYTANGIRHPVPLYRTKLLDEISLMNLDRTVESVGLHKSEQR